jgi:hypothetical protein
MAYNYLDAVTDSVRDVIDEYLENYDADMDADDIRDQLYDDLWTDDSVTGNGSGSYTFDRWKAREYVLADTDTVIEALTDFGVDAKTVGEKFLEEDWEYFDVTARCYLLGQAIDAVLEERGIV